MGARPKQTKAPIKTVAPLSHNIDVLENDERGDDEHGTEEEEEEEPMPPRNLKLTGHRPGSE